MSQSGPISERAIILAPSGRDGQIAQLILSEAGCAAIVCPDLNGLYEGISKGAGLAIIANEALIDADLHSIGYLIENQPLWSDFPIILLTQNDRRIGRDPVAVELAELLGNVTFLERPFHPTTLISLVRSAVRARRRQYEARTRLRELAEERASLSKLSATLEKRVLERTSQLTSEVATREKAQEQLLQSQKMEAIGQLTGGVAHDFNNLLMAVMGNLELLSKRLPNDPHCQRLIDGAMQGAKRGASLTQRMLAFARRQDLRAESTDLTAVLMQMRDLLDRSLGPQIDLQLHVPEDLPPAQIDANQVELAILNLAINARDAMPNGGTICIRVDNDVGETPAGLRKGAYLRLQVSDTGSGMDAATLKQAVEPFYSTKLVGKGTGLGLSMVHGLAIQLGGTLELSSEVGRGTTATLWFPVSTNPVKTVRPAIVPNAAVKVRPATILLVDDDFLISMSTVDMLQDLGHTVIEANLPKRALEILETGQRIDLMITDQAMPGMTGTELAEIVRREHPDLPILLATGYSDLPSGQSTSLPRLQKPYQQSQLQEQINRLLKGR